MYERMNVLEKISVILVTYNHEEYIKEAIESVLSQDTIYEMELIIADDCSTDSTVEIIKSYEDKTNIKFKYLDNKVNLGITKNYQRAFESAKADYVAILEGDDYWTDDKKIQKHVDFLRNHKECSMSFNRYVVFNKEKGDFIIQPWPTNQKFEYITVKGLAVDNYIGNFSTCVYRKKCLDNLNPNLFNLKVYDWMINMCVAENGLIGYLGEVMSVYRQHSKGTWSSMDFIEQQKESIKYIDIYNEYLGFRYDFEFTDHKNRIERHLVSIKQQEALDCIAKNTKILNVKKYKEYIPPIIKIIIKLFVPEKLVNKIMN